MDTTEPQQPHRPAMDNAPPVVLPTNVQALIKKLDHSKAPGEEILQVVFYNTMGKPPHSTLQQMSSSVPSSKSMAECDDGFAAQEGQHVTHKEPQAN